MSSKSQKTNNNMGSLCLLRESIEFKPIFMKYLLASLLLLSAFACKNNKVKDESASHSRVDVDALRTSSPSTQSQKSTVDDYWRQGKAELNHYKLTQNRYQDVHDGEAILVFVLEDFLYDEQVKNDHYQNPNSTPVLKTNRMLRFPTGLYDYSLMTSVFTPTEAELFPRTLKLTHSAQDWCGQGFLQLNHRNQAYKVSSYSYFESEGDQVSQMAGVMLEDEIFNRIRLNPAAIPLGKQKIIPSADVIRLKHLKLMAQDAELSLDKYEGSEFEGNELQQLTLSYPSISRKLEIVFEGNKPYEIIGWKDSYPSVFDNKIRSSMAKRTHVQLTPYWKKNAASDQGLREEFGLQTFLP
jgi:hypothetical protein